MDKACEYHFIVMQGRSVYRGSDNTRMFKSIMKYFNLPLKIGTDSYGNNYYEKLTKEGKLVRWVVQKSVSNPADYDPELIPSSWKSWLSKTRQEPPQQ